MPSYVIASTTLSVDGRVALHDKPIELTNRISEYHIQRLRGSVDAIIVDVSAFLKGDSLFPAKEYHHKHPAIVIVDKNADIPPNAAILKQAEHHVILVVGRNAYNTRIQRLPKSDRLEVLQNSGTTEINLKSLLVDLSLKGMRRVLVEAEGNLMRRFFDDGFVSELYITFAPTIAGAGVDFIHETLLKPVDLKLEGIIQFGDHVVLHYKVKSGETGAEGDAEKPAEGVKGS